MKQVTEPDWFSAHVAPGTQVRRTWQNISTDVTCANKSTTLSRSRHCRQPVMQLRRQGQNLNMEYKEAQRERTVGKLEKLAEKYPWLPATFDEPQEVQDHGDPDVEAEKKGAETDCPDGERADNGRS